MWPASLDTTSSRSSKASNDEPRSFIPSRDGFKEPVDAGHSTGPAISGSEA